MKGNTKQLLIGLGIGAGFLIVAGTIYSFIKKGQIKNGRSIIVGDSQTPFIKKQSVKIQMLGDIGGEDVLWKGGMGLSWLKGAVKKYPITKDIINVVINIGTNGGFSSKFYSLPSERGLSDFECSKKSLKL